MKLDSKIKIVAPRQKRHGLGYGSGVGGHTTGRGQKGQKARGDMPLTFIGSSWVWFKRLPFMRGKDRFVAFHPSVTVTMDDLNKFEKDGIVDEKSLGTTSRAVTYKLVNTGILTKKLTVKIKATKGAQAQIIKCGGEYQGETA